MKSPIKIISNKSESNPNPQQINIDPLVIKNLQLDVKNTREKRREISRKNKVPWNLYRKLEKLVTYRIMKNLNPSTGNNDSTIDEKEIVITNKEEWNV